MGQITQVSLRVVYVPGEQSPHDAAPLDDVLLPSGHWRQTGSAARFVK